MVNAKSINFHRYLFDSYIILNDFIPFQIFYNLSIQFVPIYILVWTKKALSNYKRIINSCVSILLTQKGVNQRALSQYVWEHVKLHQIALLERIRVHLRPSQTYSYGPIGCVTTKEGVRLRSRVTALRKRKILDSNSSTGSIFGKIQIIIFCKLVINNNYYKNENFNGVKLA